MYIIIWFIPCLCTYFDGGYSLVESLLKMNTVDGSQTIRCDVGVEVSGSTITSCNINKEVVVAITLFLRINEWRLRALTTHLMRSYKKYSNSVMFSILQMVVNIQLYLTPTRLTSFYFL